MTLVTTDSSDSPPWVLVSGGFHREGGMDKANSALAAYLRARGIPLHLVGYRFAPEFLDDPLVTVHRVAKPAGSFFLGQHRLDRSGGAMARQISSFTAARVLVNGANCEWDDINWVHFVHHAWRPVLNDAPFIHRIKDALAQRVARRREARIVPRARLVLANSDRTRENLLNLLRLAPDRAHTVYLGNDPDWKFITADRRRSARISLGIADERPLIVFVGAFGYDARKGFDTLWSAWQRLCARADWDAHLVVAGSGRTLGQWKTVVATSEYPARVSFIGHTTNVVDVLAASDLLVSPARYEPYGLNVQEAICCGVPAIVSACAGIAERYPAVLRDLLLPEADDAADLADRILRWRSDIDGWRHRIMPFTQTLRGYSWHDMAERIVNLATRLDEVPAPVSEHLYAAARV